MDRSEPPSSPRFNADTDGANGIVADAVSAEKRATSGRAGDDGDILRTSRSIPDSGDDIEKDDCFARFEFLSIEETAEYLRLDRKTVYAMIRRGDLPGVRRCGRTFRVHRPSVISWFAAKPRPVHRRGE
ncbi:MAG: helix-turn-helix domain-containing protein [Patescibacteria group bacterium]